MLILSIFDHTSWDIILVIVGLFMPIYGLFIWNSYSLRKARNVSYNSYRISEDKYYELKYRLEYITVILSVVTAAAGLFGYSWNTTITAKINDAVSQVKSLTDSLKEDQIKMEKYQQIFSSLDSGVNKTGNKISSQVVTMDMLQKRVSDIEGKDIVKQTTYIVVLSKFYIYGNADFNSRIIYYKDLKTITGKSLPAFSKIPLASVMSNEQSFYVNKVTKEYVDIQPALLVRGISRPSDTLDITLNLTVVQ